MNQALLMIRQKIERMKLRSLYEIYFKLNKKDQTYEEKNNFFEFNIEDSMKFFGERIVGNELERKRYLKRIKRQILKKELQLQMRNNSK